MTCVQRLRRFSCWILLLCNADVCRAVVKCRPPEPPVKGLLPIELRCEGQFQPLGLDVPKPRLRWLVRAGLTRTAQGKWQAKERNRQATAYQILAASSEQILASNQGNLWDSGRQPLRRLPEVEYAGKPLHSQQRVFWKVRTWDENGTPSNYSAPQWLETGLMKSSDWRGNWITSSKPLPQTEAAMFAENPAPLFRKEFDIRKPIRSARASICGLGYYELHLNGTKTGNHVLDPGWTNYSRRTLFSTYDITAQLKPGRNAVGVILGNGWYNPLPLRMWGSLNLREHLPIGAPRFIAQFNIVYQDGTRQTLASDESWKWHDSPILKNSVYLGEVYDARREISGWDKSGANEADWSAVRLAAEPIGLLRAQSAPPIRVTATLKPVAVTEPKPATYIADMGRNFAGWVRLKVRGAAGTRITLRYGELLYPDGTLNPMTSVTGQIKNRPVPVGSEAPSTAWQSDTYILKGEGEETYTPRFTFHGFRYIEITGFPGKPTLQTLTGLQLNSDVESVGAFACSNPLFNQIQTMTRRTELSNLFSVQSDCPHREKFGYGGDIVATNEMAMLNFDMSGFYAKAVDDLADAARPNGGFTETAPFVGIADAGLGEKSGPVEWGTAYPLLVRQLYRYYGNRRLLEASYSQVKRWVNTLESRAVGFILDNGIGDHEGLARPSTALSGTAFFYRNVRLLGEMAEILGNHADAEHCRTLAAKIHAAFQTQFDPRSAGRYDSGSQACQALVLDGGLVPASKRQAALDLLVHDILEIKQGHLDTGIFGTQSLFHALNDQGRSDIAGTVAAQTTFPGWGYMLAHGATTLWEHWEFSDNTFSHNHPMFGSVSEWFYKGIAGIAPADDAVGFDKVTIAPQLIKEVTWARAEYHSVRGTIATLWEQKRTGLFLTMTLPPSIRARVTLPAQSVQDITEGGFALAQRQGIRVFKQERDHIILEIGSGTYRFHAHSNPP